MNRYEIAGHQSGRVKFSGWALGMTLACVSMVGACSIQTDKPTCQDFFEYGDTGPFLRDEFGIAVDSRSGTVWFACGAGQRYSGDRCLGESVRLEWDEALSYANDFSIYSLGKWRLPTDREMQSLGNRQCENPVVNPQVFPGIESNNYWTSSPTWWGKQFACAFNTTNGSLFCRNTKKLKMRFLLVRD